MFPEDFEAMKKLTSVFAIVAMAAALAACPKKKDEPKEAPKPAADVTPVAAKETPKTPDPVKPEDKGPAVELPQECLEYRALVDKLDKCDKLGKSRDTLKASADESWKAWSALPAADKPGVAPACQQAAQGLKTAAAAACGW